MSPETRITRFGPVKVPALLAGVALSVVAHASAILVVGIVVAGQSSSLDTPPTQVISRGEPIRVFFRPDQDQEIDKTTALTAGDASKLALSRLDQQDRLIPPLRPEVRTPAATPLDSDAPSPAAFDRSILTSPDGATRNWSLTPDASPDPVAPEILQQDIDAHIPPPTVHAAPPDEPTPIVRELGLKRDVDPTDVPTPVYPLRSVRLGHEGDVEILVEVLASGQVGSVRVHRASRHKLLNEAALKAASQAVFAPATRKGLAIDSDIILPFEFRLH